MVLIYIYLWFLIYIGPFKKNEIYTKIVKVVCFSFVHTLASDLCNLVLFGWMPF